MLRKFISYYKPYKKMFFLDMLASLFISVIGMCYPILTRKVLNDYVKNENLKMILILGFSLLGLYIVRMFLRYFVQYYGHVIGVKMQADMRSDMFSHLEKLPYTYYDEHETGKIMSRMTNDLQNVSELAHHGPENFFISGVMLIGSFVYLCTINYILALLLFIFVPILITLANITGTRMNKAFAESKKSIALVNASLESSITGIRVTKAFNNKDKELEKFNISNGEYVKARKASYKAMGQYGSSTNFILDIFNVVCIIAGGICVLKDYISLGDYSAFVVSISLFTSPLLTLINFKEQYEDGVTGFKRFQEILEEEPEIEKENAKDYNLDGNIKFENVSFSYNTTKNVLNDISFEIKKGTKLALVGESGGGKTTICHLLPNFYKATSGKITIDDIDINDITYKSLRNNIGIVQQDVFLFNGTIYDNILYGRLNATFDEVVEASKKANIYDYIMSLENGFQTQIGERGVKLSGGQKQRLSIARIFLKNPSILILDEATSALDNTTEILIQNALNELSVGRTTIIVAHRLSTIKNADKIMVISKGMIEESGSHDELILKNGIYAKLYNAQFKNSNILTFNEEL